MEIIAFIMCMALWCLYWGAYWNRTNEENNRRRHETIEEARRQVKKAKVWKDDNDA